MTERAGERGEAPVSDPLDMEKRCREHERHTGGCVPGLCVCDYPERVSRLLAFALHARYANHTFSEGCSACADGAVAIFRATGEV